MLYRAIGRNTARYPYGGAQPESQAGGRNVLCADAVALIALAAIRSVVTRMTGQSVCRRGGVRSFPAHGLMAGRRLIHGGIVIAHVPIIHAADRSTAHRHLRGRVGVARPVEDQDNAEQYAQKSGGNRGHGAHTLTRRPRKYACGG